MLAEALAGLVFLPLLVACALVVMPERTRLALVLIGILPLPLLLLPVTAAVLAEGLQIIAVAGFERPLGIEWRVDGLSLSLKWLNALIAVLVGLYALADYHPGQGKGQRFWILWLLLTSAINALLLSSDLFNLFVTLELLTLAAIGLLVIDSKAAALRAGMRYLMLALLGSMLYLMGVAMIYAAAGTLDLYQAGSMLEVDPVPVVALMLMTVGLLIKSAIFPLHGWLPAAHGNAPGPVSAVLSAVVVKASIYLIWRLWFWFADGWSMDWALTLLGVLGAGAIVYGSVLACLQQRLKMMVAYSTVAQLGYLMLLFPLFGLLGFAGAGYHLLAHGVAKAAMFVAAANLLKGLGSDRMDQLDGADRKLPIDVFTFALAGVSILGLPPSGGFMAKWLLLQEAWGQAGWGWVAVLLVGGLLAAVYLFRPLAYMCARPVAAPEAPIQSPRTAFSLLGLILALLALGMGFTPAPVIELLTGAAPPGLAP